MSTDDKIRINFFFEWGSRVVIVALGSVVLYFVRDIHNEIKGDHTTIENHEVRISVLETKMK